MRYLLPTELCAHCRCQRQPLRDNVQPLPVRPHIVYILIIFVRRGSLGLLTMASSLARSAVMCGISCRRADARMAVARLPTRAYRLYAHIRRRGSVSAHERWYIVQTRGARTREREREKRSCPIVVVKPNNSNAVYCLCNRVCVPPTRVVSATNTHCRRERGKATQARYSTKEAAAASLDIAGGVARASTRWGFVFLSYFMLFSARFGLDEG